MQRLQLQQQTRTISSRKPGDVAKMMGKFTVGSGVFLAGSAVAVGVVVPTVVDVWARATSSMYMWTEKTIDRTEHRYNAMRGRMNEAARQRRIQAEEAARKT